MEGGGKDIKPTIGGVLIILSGLSGLGMWGIVLAAGGASTAEIGTVPGMEFASGFLIACGAIGVIFSIIAILGGIFAVKRTKWAIALVGGIFGLLSVGYFLGSLFGLIGLILVAISKNQFT